jgi:hypothetical protein
VSSSLLSPLSLSLSLFLSSSYTHTHTHTHTLSLCHVDVARKLSLDLGTLLDFWASRTLIPLWIPRLRYPVITAQKGLIKGTRNFLLRFMPFQNYQLIFDRIIHLMWHNHICPF